MMRYMVECVQTVPYDARIVRLNKSTITDAYRAVAELLNGRNKCRVYRLEPIRHRRLSLRKKLVIEIGNLCELPPDKPCW